MRLSRLACLAGTLLAAAVAAPASAQAPAPQATVVPAVRYNTSEPLRVIQSVPGLPRHFPYLVPNRPDDFAVRLLDPKPPGFVDPVLDDGGTAFRAGTGSVLIDWEGLSADDGQAVLGGRTAPPDPTGEAGPNHYVQMVNSITTVYDRAGTALLGPVANNTFFAGLGGDCQTRNDGDPIVVYDELADRWFISQFAIATGNRLLCIAISTTPDPTGSYHQYAFPFGAEFPDYPKFSVWPDAYYGTAPVFDSSPNHGEALAFDRTAMLQGLAASMVRITVPDGIFRSLSADLDGPTPPPAGTPGLFATLDFYSASAATREQVQIFEFDVDWANPGAATFTRVAALPTAPFALAFSGRSNIPQPGTADRVDAFGDRPMFRLQYRNQGTHQTMLLNHNVDAGSGRAGIRWYELRNTGAGWSLYQESTYAPADDVHRWMGSIAMNAAGDIALAYSASSSTVFPSLRFTGQTAGASGTGVMDVAETEIVAGAGSQLGSSNRWGDYSQLAVDPTDDATFWYTGEYISNTASFDWKTRNARISITEVDPPILAVTPGSVSVSTTLAAGETTDEPVTVSNTADADAAVLTVQAAVANLSQPGDAARVTPQGQTTAPRAKDAPGAGPDPFARLGAGGPDTFGNTFVDSNEPGGPAFAWVDISSTGTAVPLGDDAVSAAIDLPFDFPFYGTDKTQVYIGSNGYLTFGTAGNTGTASRTNQNLPSTTAPNDLIAMYWDDLNPALTGSVRYRDMGDGRFVVQFTGVPHYNTASEASTFQAILYPSGQIDLQYLTMTDDASDPTSNTVGIENADGTDALLVAFNAAYVENNLLVRITPLVSWASVAPAALSIAPGASDTFTLTFDAAGLPDGVYTGDLVLTSNDFTNPSVTLPISLAVSDGASVAVIGVAGWRMVAPPAAGLTVDDLAALNLVQGVPGFYPAAATNLFTGYDGGAFTITGAGAPLAPGRGAFWYFYDTDLDPGGPSQSFALPMSLTTALTPTTTDTDVTLSAAGDGSNLLGNPFGDGLDVSDVGSWTGAGNLSSTVVQVYDANAAGYVTSATDPVISTWQGFWAEAATTGTLTIPASARATGGTFVRRTAGPTLAFELSTADGARRDRAAVVRFSDDASDGTDVFDAAKRAPAAAAFVTLAPEGTADGEAVLRAVETRATPTTPAVVPLHAHAVGTGEALVLTWPTLNLPDDWSAELRDLATGAAVDLREQTAYAFTLAAEAARGDAVGALGAALGARIQKTGDARFELAVGPGSLVASDADGADVLSLGAPFPNPSRELARVPFTLAQAGAVRLSVVDALGREVVVLVEGERSEGEHAATLDTRRLAAGLYVIRLAAGGEVMTQRATVVR